MPGINVSGSLLRPQSDRPEPKNFGELRQLWLSQPYGEVQISYENYIQEHSGLEQILNCGPCVTWILDMRTLHFAYLSQNVKEIFGYDCQQFREKGLGYFNQIMHPEDISPTWHLVKEIWECLMALPPYQRRQHKLHFSYRIIKPDSTIVKVLEQNTVLQLDDKGHITHLIGVCSDISQLENSANSKAKAIPVIQNFPLFKAPVNPNPAAILSKRELQIVKLIAAGYKSRDIAEKLFISFNTVNTHRQKIIEKTKTRNSGELIRFAMDLNLI
ncbi:MAG: hypothetical protein JWQ14_1037 [Adhaeribacter sp.]|nr:hypothetical protein [Adhaeribacter sp.]